MVNRRFFTTLSVLIFGLWYPEICMAQGKGWPDWGTVKRINPAAIAEARANLDTLGVKVDPDNKQQVLDSLQSPSAWVRENVERYCGYAQIRESIPLLKDLFLQHVDFTERLAILNAVTLLEDTTFQQQFRELIDTLRSHPDEFSTTALFVGYLMAKNNDDYGFDALAPFYTNEDSVRIYRPNLGYWVLFAAKHFTQVCGGLEVNLHSNPFAFNRYGALNYLSELQFQGTDQLAYETSKVDSSPSVRAMARSILKKLDFNLYVQSLVDATTSESDPSARQGVYGSLAAIGELWSYELLVDLYRSNKDSVNNWFLKADIENPYFQKPGADLSPIVQIDTLKADVAAMFATGWLGNNVYANQLINMLDYARALLIRQDSVGCTKQIKSFQEDIDESKTDSTTSNRYVSLDGARFLHDKARFLMDRLPAFPAGLSVQLMNSVGDKLVGGYLQYYDGSWKDAVNNSDGTFTVNTSLKTMSLRMTYAYGSQTKSNVPVNGGPVTFQTVNTQVKLQNSRGTLIDQGIVQYYAGAWRDFGTTVNGIVSNELLANSYPFRMTYSYGSNDKQQDIGTNPVVVFQTVNAAVQLQNSQGVLMDQGTVQYYAGAWRDFGTTSNGVAKKELLPNNYSFRITYAYASKDKQQNIGTNSTVIFNTVNAVVQLKNSLGNLIDQGSVQYYAGAWRDFGTTTSGVASKELLPNNYSFRMTYDFVSNDKSQDIGANNTVIYSTVLCTVNVADAQGQAVNGTLVSYYAGAWRQIGATVNGGISKELLPANLTFRITYGSLHQDKIQNLSTNAIVNFVIQ
jgi:hypothetical protein